MEDFRENLEREIQEVAHMGDMVADRVEIRVSGLDKDNFGNTIENSERVEKYDVVSDYSYVVLTEGSSGDIYTNGVEVNYRNGDTIQLVLDEVDGMDVENLIEMVSEFEAEEMEVVN